MASGPRRPAPRNRRHVARTLVVAGLLSLNGFWPGDAWADEPDAAAGRAAAASRLRQIEQAASEAALAQQRLGAATAERAATLLALTRRSVDLAASVQESEATLSALEAELSRLEAQQALETAVLANGRRRQGQLFAALERLAVRPPEALALAAPDPLQSVRAAALSAATIQALRDSADRLRADLARLAALTRDIADRRSGVARHGARLAVEQLILTAVVAERQALQRQDERDLQALSGRLAALASQAADLRDLIQRLDRQAEADRAKAEAAPPPAAPIPRAFSETAGTLLYPAAGRILRRWGEPDAFGTPAKGFSLQTRPGAEVVAPFDGQIMFAGEFKGYGRILIIQHGGGYHSVLTGLDRIDGRPGEWVVAGAPVGRMADAEMQDIFQDGAKSAMPASGSGDRAAQGPVLYFEFRRAGQPIDPQRWLIGRETAK